jgi:hypothetical protein
VYCSQRIPIVAANAAKVAKMMFYNRKPSVQASLFNVGKVMSGYVVAKRKVPNKRKKAKYWKKM